jgi:RHS repeat-associated protein
MGGVTTTYIGNYFEWVSSTSDMKKYYYAGGTRVAVRTGSTLNYLLGDHLGSTAITTNSSGVKSAEMRYYPWGGQRYAWNTTPTTMLFTGQRRESSFGLYYYSARWYDPAVGRFIQADTEIPQQQGVQAWDRYAYVNNSPVKYTDPTGHNAYCESENADPDDCTGDDSGSDDDQSDDTLGTDLSEDDNTPLCQVYYANCTTIFEGDLSFEYLWDLENSLVNLQAYLGAGAAISGIASFLFFAIGGTTPVGLVGGASTGIFGIALGFETIELTNLIEIVREMKEEASSSESGSVEVSVFTTQDAYSGVPVLGLTYEGADTPPYGAISAVDAATLLFMIPNGTTWSSVNYFL